MVVRKEQKERKKMGREEREKNVETKNGVRRYNGMQGEYDSGN